MHARISALLLAFVLALTGLAYAQGTTGTISGRIVDPQGLAVPGVTITVTGAQGAKTAVTDGSGRFSVPFLTPGTYAIKAELQGFKSIEQKDIVVRLEQTVDLPLTMQVGGLTETVEVTGASPVVDTQTTTAGANLDSAMLSRLPVGRSLAETLYVAPGVSSGGGTGTANPSIGGGSGLENQYVVDGVNISSTGFGSLGSYSRVAALGSLGNGVTFDFIKEVQVKTAGYEAEFGQSTGGVVNVVTKSGTNEVHGTLFGYSRPNQLESKYKQIHTANGWVNTTGTTLSDFGAEVGGPAVRNHLFFFGAIDPQWDKKWTSAPDNTSASGALLFPLRAMGEVPRERKFLSYSAKGTLEMNSNNRITASFFGDPGSGPVGPQRNNALLGQDTARFSSFDKFGGHNQVVKYDGVLTSAFLLEASWARAKNSTIEVPSVNSWNVIDTRVTPQIRTGGIGFFENNEGENKQYQAKATFVRGGHQLKGGVALEDITFADIPNYTGPTFTLPNGVATKTGAAVTILPDPAFGSIWRATRANYVLGRSTEQTYLNFFAQDNWQIGDRLTFRPGVRYEQQEIVGTLKKFKWDKNWAPRIGVTYDPTGSSKSKVYANWGRFYAKVPNDLAARALSADAGISRADFFDANLTRPVPEGTLAAGQTRHFILAGQNASDFDPDAKSTYMDEFLVGTEYEALPGMNVGVRWVTRRMPRILEDVGTAQMVAYDLGLPGLDSVEYFITNVSSKTPTTVFAGLPAAHFEDPIHKYDAIELTADKRLSNNWSLQSSYRLSWLRGNFEGFYRNDNGQSDPAISSLFDFPTDDISYTSIGAPRFGYRGDIRFLGALGQGPLPNDRRHQVKLYGTYNTRARLNLGAGINLSSGMPLTQMAANPNYASPGEIPMTARGEGFQTVDGVKTRTPMEPSINAHVDYAIGSGIRRVVLLADVFNLGNIQRVTGYNNYFEFPQFGTLNPDFGAIGNPVTLVGYQIPQQIRFGARFEF
ncbi:MAG TPA: TonB-dependent receptor [Vicinamibacterales bacterium]|jgi:outer membrane receptor protein involved in Fe transport